MAPPHMFDMLGDILGEQRSMATKFGFLEAPVKYTFESDLYPHV